MSQIYVEKGQVMPCECEKCAALYAPPMGSDESTCPICGNVNDHSKQTWVLSNPE